MGLSRIRIAVRLPAAFLLLVAVSLAVLGVFSYRSAKDTLILTGQAELLDVAEARAKALEHWSNSVGTDIEMQARSPFLVNVLRTYGAAWSVLGPDAGEQLRELYITQNTYPAFERFAFTDAGDGSVYSRAHARFHDHFLSLLRRGSYRDIYLINDKGDIVYSVAKQDDFASNIGDVPGDAFYSAVSDMLAQEQPESVKFVDFFDYGSSFDPSAFVIAPVYGEMGGLIGAVAYRISDLTIVDNLGETAGLGQTGQSFAIGSDGVNRTEVKGWNNGAISADSPLQAALRQEPGVTSEQIPQSYLQNQMVAFAPTTVFGQPWIVLASKDIDEILAPVSNFMSQTLIVGGVILVLAAAVGLWIAMTVTVPLRDIAKSIQSVSEEDYDSDVPHVSRRDEIGSIATALEELRVRLLGTKEMTTDMAFKSAALESTSAALMMTDNDFTITYMNEAVKVMMRSQADEFRKVLSTFDPDNLIGTNMDVFHAKPEQIRQLIDNPEHLPFRTDIRVGNARVQIELNAVWSEDNVFSGLVVEWVDVTEERRKTSVLGAIESGQILAECDMTGRFVRMNENFLNLIGKRSEEMVGTDFGQRVELEGETMTQRGILDVLCNGTPVQGRFLLHRDGQENAIVEGGFYPVIDRRKETIGVTLIGSDVTDAQLELRDAEARQKAMQEAQRAVVVALRVGMRDISNGDLRTRLDTPFAAEYEQLRTDFNDALENLTRAMVDIASETGAMHSETSEIVKAADEMSVRTERQAMTLQETASSLDELTTNITQTANGAARANEVVIEARASAEQSGTVVDEAENAMAEIAASSKEIVKVISVIDDISFQTNLLALNAGVEAARAGEAGRGFAVVATEVRALAQRCANAAAEINQLITISGQHVNRGVELVGVTGETLKKIVSSISDISDYIAEIAQAGKEQSIGLAQVNSAVNQIDHVTQQNAAMFEETTSASHALAQRANSLADTIGHFQIGGRDERREPRRPAPASVKEKRAAKSTVATKGNLALAPKSNPEAHDWEDF